MAIKQTIAGVWSRVWLARLVPVFLFALSFCWLSYSFWSSESYWRRIEYASTAVVVIGCAGEYIADFKPFRKWPKRRKRFAKCSTLILVVGLAFELLGMIRTSQISDLQVSTLKNQNLKIQSQLMPRGLNLDQLIALRARLSRFAPQEIDVVQCGDLFEVEQADFAICEALEMAGWKVHQSSWFATGWLVEIRTRKGADQSVLRAADELTSALNDEHILTGWMGEFSGQPLGITSGDITYSAPIRLLVGEKQQFIPVPP